MKEGSRKSYVSIVGMIMVALVTIFGKHQGWDDATIQSAVDTVMYIVGIMVSGNGIEHAIKAYQFKAQVNANPSSDIK